MYIVSWNGFPERYLTKNYIFWNLYHIKQKLQEVMEAKNKDIYFFYTIPHTIGLNHLKNAINKPKRKQKTHLYSKHEETCRKTLVLSTDHFSFSFMLFIHFNHDLILSHVKTLSFILCVWTDFVFKANVKKFTKVNIMFDASCKRCVL